MANLTANSGTTFISDGGSVGVQVNTNTNWRFYLTGSTGVPDWLHFNGNVTEITGSESQLVNVEATKNNNSTARSASGICVSTSETGLTAWTLFYQGAGGGSGSDGIKLTLQLKLQSTSGTKKIQGLAFEMPSGVSIIGDWGYYGNSICDWWDIPVYTNAVTTLSVEIKSNVASINTNTVNNNNICAIIPNGGSYYTVNPGRYQCVVGVRWGSSQSQKSAIGHYFNIVDQGNGTYLIDFGPAIGGDGVWKI